MRVKINRLSLVGTSREFEFGPGLNVITGPITTGKTTLLRLCRGLFGSGLTDFPREVREHVSALAGQIELQDEAYSVVRPFVSTGTAKVDVAADGRAWRLPAFQPDATADTTYGQWLLGQLGLPRLEVPSAPTRAESTPTPISINDYFLYCELAQDEIDNSVFSHRDSFKNIKRRYVFEVVYGLYSVEMARIQDELRTVLAGIRQLQSASDAFSRFLSGTALENRAEIDRIDDGAVQELRSLEAETQGVAFASLPASATSSRDRLSLLDVRAAELSAKASQERASLDQLQRLLRQLETQSARLTRSIVADTYLSDFEFLVCPRCGHHIDAARGSATECSLCLQEPSPTLTREALMGEQDRLGAQILETRQLLEDREEVVRALDDEASELQVERSELVTELEFQTRTYVSENASRIAELSARRAELHATIAKLREYKTILSKLDGTAEEIQRLETRKVELEGALESEASRRQLGEQRIEHLEQRFEEILEIFGVPRFTPTPRATIARNNYLPVIDGRRFDELSSQGLQVLVNVAHALAHQLTSIDLGLSLPNILFIDGLTSNVGHEGFDWERVEAVYGYLVQLSESLGDRLQLIVADNDVPQEAARFVRARFSPEDRLIPVA